MRYGELRVVCGPMFSGKTECLVREVVFRTQCRGEAVRVFRPGFDARAGGAVLLTHDGVSVPAEVLRHAGQIAATEAALIVLDEIQFLEQPMFDGDIAAAIRAARGRGIDVWCAGLDMDFRGRAFDVSAALMAESSEIVRRTARCARCGAPATHTARTREQADRFAIGGADAYAPMCRAHWWRDRRQDDVA